MVSSLLVWTSGMEMHSVISRAVRHGSYRADLAPPNGLHLYREGTILQQKFSSKQHRRTTARTTSLPVGGSQPTFGRTTSQPIQ